MRGKKTNWAKLCMAAAGIFFLGFPGSAGFARPEAPPAEEASENSEARVFSVIVQEIARDVQGQEAQNPRVYDIISMTMSKGSYTFKLSLSKLSILDFKNSSCMGMEKPQGLGERAASKPLIVFSSSSRPTPPWPAPLPFVITDQNNENLPLDHPFAANDWTAEKFAEILEKIALDADTIILRFPDRSSLDITPDVMTEPLFNRRLCGDYDISRAVK